MGHFKALAKSAVNQVFPGFLHNRYIRALTLDEREVLILDTLCGTGETAIDVGANRGLYVHHLLPITSAIVAFEPLPPMAQELRRHYGGRIRLETVALSNAEGTADLRYPEGNFAWATMAPTNTLSLAGEGMRFETVHASVRTLDSYDFRGVGFIKIDVEGHEEEVLLGAAQTLARETPNLVIEVEERHRPGAVARIVTLLAGFGYDGFFLDGAAIRNIASFDIARDQDVRNIGPNGKAGRYLNNFIFVPKARAARWLDDAGEKLTARIAGG